MTHQHIIMLLCLCAVLASIALGNRTRRNTGLFAMVFAYGLGCFGMGMKPSELIGLFSVKILFLLLSVSLFYGYAVENGTLTALAGRIIYCFRKQTRLLPFLLYLVCFLISVLGASPPVVCSFMAPVCFSIAAQTGLNPLLMCVLIATGSGAGACVPWSSAGAVISGIAVEAGYGAEAFGLSLKICLNFFLAALTALVILYLAFRGFRAKPLQLEKPKPLTRIQRINLAVILGALALLLLPPVIQIIRPNPIAAAVSRVCDTQMVSILGAVLCGFLKLADERQVIHKVPWSTILTVCGIGMLLGVADRAGATEMAAGYLSSGISTRLIVLVLLLVGGFMSFFTGGVTVVIPMLLPLALQAAAAPGTNLTLLASAAALGGMATGMSPFSTGGSLVAAGMPGEEARAKLIGRQFAVTFVVWAVVILFGVTGLFGVLD